MIIQKIETWWVRRNKCLFDDKRKGKSAMDWDVLVLKLTTECVISNHKEPTPPTPPMPMGGGMDGMM